MSEVNDGIVEQVYENEKLYTQSDMDKALAEQRALCAAMYILKQDHAEGYYFESVERDILGAKLATSRSE